MADRNKFDIAPLRILHVFSRLNCGGAEKRTLEVARYLQNHPDLKRRIQIDYCVLSGEPGDLDDEARAMGASLHYLPLRKPGFPRRFVALLRNEGYDVVHSHVHYSSGFLIELARFAGIRNRIAHFRSQQDGKANPLRKPFRWVMKRLIDRSATHILGVSRCVMEAVWGPHWLRDRRCQVIYNGIDLGATVDDESEAVRARLLQSLGLPADTRLVVHVGSYRQAKNHLRLIDIFRQVHRQEPRSYLLLVGDLAKGWDRLKKQIVSYGLDKVVHFLGLRRNIPQILRSADVMIFPSLWEGLPGAVLESLAVGTPVVASDIPPHREIKGWLPGITLVPLDLSDEEWADRIVFQPRPDEDTRRKARRAFAESPFSLERCVASLLAVWRTTGLGKGEKDESCPKPEIFVIHQTFVKGRAA
ncbi:MAG: glycosyltransferase [Thermogutta sp.]